MKDMTLTFFVFSNVEVTGDLRKGVRCLGGVGLVVEVNCELTSEWELES